MNSQLVNDGFAQKSFAAGAPPQTPLRELTTLPKPLGRLGRG